MLSSKKIQASSAATITRKVSSYATDTISIQHAFKNFPKSSHE
jgi:hypothetical protein